MKLCDFGLAKLRDSAQVTKKRSTLGTPAYMSPERIRGITSIYARLGERDQAFEWLHQAYEERFTLLPWLKLDPRFDSLRSDSRFGAMLKKIEVGNDRRQEVTLPGQGK